MKSLIDRQLMRRLGIIFASISITVGVANVGLCGVSAKAKDNTTTQSIDTLKKSAERWIQIDLTKQKLIAWEGKTPVYAIIISTGKKSTPTRVGTFKIQTKLKSTRMRGRDYDVPNVPYAMFYQGNYGIHGAYWHRRFGTPVSHGCVNVAPNHAKWLFDWASVGTAVFIHR
ncbi:L,D-transpeptidase [Calothrix sp. FACHB-1219]|uniref:L,D-transpeptidase n=1 Tax=unclassified Calothrix TaxID=2619626 RepID=UPI0016862399|nr:MULTISPECIES: L,D-transpeptidase [unclassified Calothrix]MBD2204647.1 L,D-transpeptidase [Calothrix sp. FACHB-168]MBD2216841.1 L,D-transpeptidase [Calothrix sp. FACHB-1219]